MCRRLLCQYRPNYGWTKQGREQLKLCTVQQIKHNLVIKIFCLLPVQQNNLAGKGCKEESNSLLAKPTVALKVSVQVINLI